MHKIRFSQTQTIALGFFLIIAAGTILLLLPAATTGPGHAPFTTAFFTATSASCVTGLVLQDTGTYWSVFGRIVILTMIQIGGLGFMTIATFFSIILRRKIGIRERAMLSESINIEHIGGVVKLTRRISLLTLSFEGVGALLLSFRFIPQFGFWKGLGSAVFHSISAFCNAGFDLMGSEYGPYSSFTAYSGDWYVCFVLIALITVGGIGFLVWDDISHHKYHWKRYHLHTKIVILISALLTFGGALVMFILQGRLHANNIPFDERILTSLFDSVTARTAGFNTSDTAAYTPGSKLFTIILMFVGGSPGSTAGGIKTTTIAVLMLYAFSYIRQNNSYGIYGRRLEDDALKKAIAVFFTNLSLTMIAVIIIADIQNFSIIDIMFECFSAIGTVGMSAGVTRALIPVSKYIIIFLMYVGRVGSVSFASALSEKKTKPPVVPPVEKITIG